VFDIEPDFERDCVTVFGIETDDVREREVTCEGDGLAEQPLAINAWSVL
jgi:hypothetical protein